jgi:glutathione S-transferase
MSITLYHHPMSRAATVVWMLEECGVPYELVQVGLMGSDLNRAAVRAINPMGKIPVLVDDGVAIMESAAIGMYLADRYSAGVLAPALDDPARGPYLRWCVYSPAVVEVACMANAFGWQYKSGQAGFGKYDDVVTTLDSALSAGPWLLGERFTMADVILGGTLLWMLQFQMIEARPSLVAYADRLKERPAKQAANERNAAAAAAG